MIPFRKFIQAGLSVIPIAADGSKAPTVAWKKYQTAPASLSIAEAWESRYQGIAICCGYGGVEAIDVDAPELVDLMLGTIPPGLLERLCVIATPQQDESGNHAVHFLYRCADPGGNTKLAMADSKTTLIETRGRGGYVLTVGCDPRCHPTGGTYEWIGGPDVFHLEQITSEERDLLFRIASQFDRTPIATSSSCSIQDGRPGDDFERATDWESILCPHGWQIVRVCGDVTYWRRPGKSHGWSATSGVKSQAGRELFCVFSTNAMPFEGPAAGRPCSTYGKFAAWTMLNHGGDFKRAAEQLAKEGYGLGGSVNISGILRDESDESEYDDDQDDDLHAEARRFPEECLNPSGLLSEIAEHTNRTALYRQPELALAAAIGALATVTGRKVTDSLKTRTNVYLLGLAESGTGKDHARQINKEILMRAGGEKLNGSERVGSHAGIVNAVFESPALLMQLDEIGRLLATMKDPRKAPHLYNCITVLMQLYSSSGSTWKADAYADSKKVRTIDQPHLVIYGTATPDSFWHNLSTENIAEGLVGRLLVFEGRGYEVEMQMPSAEGVPQDIVDAFRWWLDYRPGGNLGDEHPAPTIVPHSHDALARFMDHVREINRRRKNESKLRAALWSRSGEKAAKLALIHACSRARLVPGRIEIEDVEWGIALANWITRRILRACGEHVAENEQEAIAKRVLQIVGSDRITMSQLTRKTQWLRRRQREELIQDLIDSGRLEIERIPVKEGSSRQTTYVFRRLAARDRS